MENQNAKKKQFGFFNIAVIAALLASAIGGVITLDVATKSQSFLSTSGNYPYSFSDILYFNPAKNSGWIYIAHPRPLNNKTFWIAMVRSASITSADDSAHLIYGIGDTRSGDYYSNTLAGSLVESSNKLNVSFKYNEKTVIKFSQVGANIQEIQLATDLPYKANRYRINETISFDTPVLYESGDGMVPMAPGLNSLYVSLVSFNKDYWVDFQKFQVGSLDKVLSKLTANHRWGSFILNELNWSSDSLKKGTVGVYWEILDSKGNRQPGGYTNFDLLSPRQSQKTSEDFEIKEISCWNSGHKTYLRRYEIIQKDFGVHLVAETIQPNQEFTLLNPISGKPIYFYEGAVKILDPATNRLLGFGMLEQTHNEAMDDIKCLE